MKSYSLALQFHAQLPCADRHMMVECKQQLLMLGKYVFRLGVQPDTQAGTALLHACTRNGQIDMAQTVFEELFGEQWTRRTSAC